MTGLSTRLRGKDHIIGMISAVIILGYLIVNWDVLLSGSAKFMFTTIGVFVWLCLVMLYLIYDICEELRKDMGYTMEDNLVEIRLLKELAEKQIDYLESLHPKHKKSTKAPALKKKSKKRK